MSNEQLFMNLVEEMINQNTYKAFLTLFDCFIYHVDLNGNPYDINQIQEKVIDQLESYANRGSGIALALLSSFYLYGLNYAFPPNVPKALQLAKRSAGLGESMGEVTLGLTYFLGLGAKKNNEKALEWFKTAESKNNPFALNNIGSFYEAGLAGLKKDLDTAIRYYRASASQDCSIAMFNLGKCYENGTGVAQDFSQAIHWYQLAANKGFASAQNNLAIMYELGKGVEPNMNEAIKWYLLAGHSNRPELEKFKNAIDYLYNAGYGELIEKVKAELKL